MDGASSAHGKDEKHAIFWLENLKGRDQLEDLGMDGKINIRIDLREIWWEGLEWIHLAQDRDQRRVLVNTVTNLRVP
jgi:hypothetical protein